MLAFNVQGAHPSTQLCLTAMQRLENQADFSPDSPLKVLDMGCGNGILSVAAAGIWGAEVLAVDISETALNDARIHIENHDLTQRIRLIRSDGFAAPDIARQAPYDIILFNMLAEFHIRFAQAIRHHLAPGGYGILCGILAWLADDVKQAYNALGFEIIEEFKENPWVGYLVRDARHPPDLQGKS